MRNFSEDEQAILLQIVEPHNNPLSSGATYYNDVFVFLNNIAKDLEVTFIFDNVDKVSTLKSDLFSLRFDDKGGPILPHLRLERARRMFDTLAFLDYKVVVLLSLLDYLEKNSLVYLVHLGTRGGNTLTINGEQNFKHTVEEKPFLTGKMQSRIFEILQLSIFPSPELIEFVNNGFKDKEQIRHDQNLSIQWIAVYSALGLGVLSILLSIYEDPIKEKFGIAESDKPKKESKKENSPVTFEKREIPIFKQK